MGVVQNHVYRYGCFSTFDKNASPTNNPIYDILETFTQREYKFALFMCRFIYSLFKELSSFYVFEFYDLRVIHTDCFTLPDKHI